MRRAIVWFLLLASLAPVFAAESGNKSATEAHRLWVITDVVLDRHVSPPVRQQLLMTALQAAFRTNGKHAPIDLARRVSQVVSEKQLADLLELAGPKVSKPDALASAMLQALPGRAALLSADDLKQRGIHTGNRYVGTGIQISVHAGDGYMQILNPISGAPARRAGAKPGDLILAVDGVDMKGHSIQDVVKRIGGQEGKRVMLLVRQPQSTQTRTLRIVRGVVPFDNVVGYRRTGEQTWQYRVDPRLPVIYLRVEDLTSSTARQLRQLEARLVSRTRGVVLDLRQARGLELDYAGQVADALLDGGLLWRILDARGNIHDIRADRDCLFRGLPMVVLIDGSTTGKLPLVAAALRTGRHAILVGQSAFADPWVRELMPLSAGLGTLELATARVELPPAARGKPHPRPATQDVGGPIVIDPDERVDMSRPDWNTLQVWNRQQELPEPPADAMRTRPADAQLARALSLLEARLKQGDKP
jgi:C-terminal peptidase prc